MNQINVTISFHFTSISAFGGYYNNTGFGGRQVEIAMIFRHQGSIKSIGFLLSSISTISPEAINVAEYPEY